jgi:hypothetical protein
LDQHLARQGRKRYLKGKWDNLFTGIFRMYIAVRDKSLPFIPLSAASILCRKISMSSCMRKSIAWPTRQPS